MKIDSRSGRFMSKYALCVTAELVKTIWWLGAKIATSAIEPILYHLAHRQSD